MLMLMECPNIFVQTNLTQTNVRIDICDQYIAIIEYSNIFVTLCADRHHRKHYWYCNPPPHHHHHHKTLCHLHHHLSPGFTISVAFLPRHWTSHKHQHCWENGDHHHHHHHHHREHHHHHHHQQSVPSAVSTIIMVMLLLVIRIREPRKKDTHTCMCSELQAKVTSAVPTLTWRDMTGASSILLLNIFHSCLLCGFNFLGQIFFPSRPNIKRFSFSSRGEREADEMKIEN